MRTELPEVAEPAAPTLTARISTCGRLNPAAGISISSDAVPARAHTDALGAALNREQVRFPELGRDRRTRTTPP